MQSRRPYCCSVQKAPLKGENSNLWHTVLQASYGPVKKMQRDFKVGMLLGLILAMAGILWLSTRASLTPAAGMPDSHSVPAPFDRLRSGLQGPAGPPSPVTYDPNAGLQAKSDQSRETRDEGRIIQTQRFHIVREDETLSAISQQYYGSPNKWQKIFQANRSRLKDPDRITPGTRLIIPD